MYETRVCLPVATAVALAVVLPFAQLRSYGDITAISLLSFAAVVACITLIMSELARPGAGGRVVVDVAAARPDRLSSVGGFFFASAGGQCAFFEYLTEMEVPAEYPKTLALVTPSLFALYYATAAIMYSRFGDKVPGFLLDILPFDNTRLLGNALFYFHIVVSFTILNTALLRAYASHSVTDPSFAAKREWGLMSLCVLGLAYALTNTVSVFEDMTAALGALFVSTTVLVIPPAYLLCASAQSAAGDAEAGSPPKMGTGEVITIKKGDAPAEEGVPVAAQEKQAGDGGSVDAAQVRSVAERHGGRVREGERRGERAAARLPRRLHRVLARGRAVPHLGRVRAAAGTRGTSRRRSRAGRASRASAR